MRISQVGTLAVVITMALASASMTNPQEDLPLDHFLPSPEVEQKLQAASEELSRQITAIIRAHSRPGKIAIHKAGGSKILVGAWCGGGSLPVHPLYPKVFEVIENGLRAIGRSTVSTEATEEAKEQVLSSQSGVLWEQLGIVEPETSAKVGRATGAVTVILLEPDDISITPDHEVVRGEAKVLDTDSAEVLGVASVSVELAYECPPSRPDMETVPPQLLSDETPNVNELLQILELRHRTPSLDASGR